MNFSHLAQTCVPLIPPSSFNLFIYMQSWNPELTTSARVPLSPTTTTRHDIIGWSAATLLGGRNNKNSHQNINSSSPGSSSSSSNSTADGGAVVATNKSSYRIGAPPPTKLPSSKQAIRSGRRRPTVITCLVCTFSFLILAINMTFSTDSKTLTASKRLARLYLLVGGGAQ